MFASNWIAFSNFLFEIWSKLITFFMIVTVLYNKYGFVRLGALTSSGWHHSSILDQFY